jgi:RHH-type proline utilization regulon transcriptional repressor/proline dehydrogenase/delta 1-pyrroline-5-carboxylate dehydrogenase
MRHPEDPTGLAAEGNAFRYLPLRSVLLCRGRGPGASDAALAGARAAAAATGVSVSVCDEAGLLARAAAAASPHDSSLDKVRFLGVVDDATRLAAHDAGWWVDDIPAAAAPDREILRWVREQAVSERLHRHGNITGRRPGLGR